MAAIRRSCTLVEDIQAKISAAPDVENKQGAQTPVIRIVVSCRALAVQGNCQPRWVALQVFHTMRSYGRQKAKLHASLTQTVLLRRRALLGRAWHPWAKYTNRCTVLRGNAAITARARHRSSLHRCWKWWTAYVCLRSEKLAKVCGHLSVQAGTRVGRVKTDSLIQCCRFHLSSTGSHML